VLLLAIHHLRDGQFGIVWSAEKNDSTNCWLTADAAGSTPLLLHSYPTCSASIETDPPSTPSTGNATRSEGVRVPITYRSGR
jgi:hypothetical protein